MSVRTQVVAGALCAAVVAALGAGPAVAAPAAGGDRTSAREARRVDRVATPVLRWRACDEPGLAGLECASMAVPLDYDAPAGPTTTLAVSRLRATDQAGRIGSLVLNNGGPGGAARSMPLWGEYFGAQVRRRFDLVGLDPRGIGGSDQVRCFASTAAQQEAARGVDFVVPQRRAQYRAAAAYAAALGRACTGTTSGRAVGAAMSSAQVARDIEVLRRALGDPKLNYFGLSYGSVLGQHYAAMFPDRLRALVVDGVLDARDWRGDRGRGGLPTFVRTGSAAAMVAALDALFDRCRAAGPAACPLVARGNPAAVYAAAGARLHRRPAAVPIGGGAPFLLTDDAFALLAGDGLYGARGEVDLVATFVRDVSVLADPASDAAARAAAQAGVRGYLTGGGSEAAPAADEYDNGREAQMTVVCLDGRHAGDVREWWGPFAEAGRTGGHIGRFWASVDQPCATGTWPARDEDRYTGGFDRHTAAPVLVVGNRWDPVTPLAAARAVARLLPRGRLVASESWGHTAYGWVPCVAGVVDRYLVEGDAPRETACRGRQPFPPAGAARQAPAAPRWAPLLPRWPAAAPAAVAPRHS
ncbi:peptidase [Pilimelia terevasa]|uniref:Peptidase n=1 Tax=Pilimelia terevasa TaxID=53372 RepID=A0A8J3FL70_9ACTN|nr:alpha/beta fold hydrolase [Pilimelia terevasa]GGK38680.1 peptidase [Pilimelia terevasa]